MDKQLKNVVLTKKDTCLSYALKRVGIETHVEYVNQLEEDFHFIPFSVEACPGEGTLVTWCRKQSKISVPFEITKDGHILNHDVTIDFHIGVIEDSKISMVSDCTRKLMPNHVPCIRIRSFEDVRYPDYILVQKMKT